MFPLLLEPEDLHEQLKQGLGDNTILIDLGSEERFEKHHLPNARLVTPKDTQAGPPIPGLLPQEADLNSLVQRIGLTPDSHVIVYDDEGGGWAGRFIWLLDEIGHSNYSYLNGGLTAWIEAGFEHEAGASTDQKGSMTVTANRKHTVTAEQLMSALNSDALLVWDARSPGEHTGEKKNAARAGRIPGAINYEWTEAMDKTRALRLKPLETLKQELAGRNLDLTKSIVTHCQSHHRSGLTYLIAKILGAKDVKAYAGSWGEWGNREDTPVEC